MPLPDREQRENAALRSFGCFSRVVVWILNTVIVLVLAFVLYFVIGVPLLLIGVPIPSWLVVFIPALLIAIGVVYVFDVVTDRLIASIFGWDEPEQERREDDEIRYL